MFQSLQGSASRCFLVVKLVMAVVISGSLLGMAGLTLTGALIAMVIATRVLVLFSPILVPSVGVVTLVTTGFLFSGCCLVAAIVAMVFMYRYMAGKKRLATEQLGCFSTRIAGDVKEREPSQGSSNGT